MAGGDNFFDRIANWTSTSPLKLDIRPIEAPAKEGKISRTAKIIIIMTIG